MKWPLIPILALLVGCTAAPETTRSSAPDFTLPPMKTFGSSTPVQTRLSNSQIARDYLDLVFRLENGDRVPVFSRFEGPITVRVTGTAPATLTTDLDQLLTRFRREAGIDISRVPADTPASITVAPVPRAQIQKVAPSAACFVRPNVSGWEEYRARRNDPDTFWNRLAERRTMAVFLPNDVSPQEVRDCLHEEIAQALGPVNDIYRLSDSIFNDDNFHTVLTGYDMLILAVHYDAALSNGMTQLEVMERLPGILRRRNPGGGGGGIDPARPLSNDWTTAIARATDVRSSKSRRRGAAERAVSLAQQAGIDTQLAFSYYVLGRLTLGSDPDTALKSFLTAGKIYQARPDTRVQEAHVALQIAAFQLSAGRGDVAELLVDQNLDVVRRSQHAALLSLMLLLKAEAQELQDRPDEAGRTQREALAWARYGFGDPTTIRTRVNEITAISPRTRNTTGGPT